MGDEEIIRPVQHAHLYKSPTTDERSWLEIYKRVVKPLSYGTVLVD